MEPAKGYDARAWLGEQLVETERLIRKLHEEVESPKRALALGELGRLRRRILRFLHEVEPPG